MRNIRILTIFVLLFSFLIVGYAKKIEKKESPKINISAQDQRKLDYYFYEAMNQKQLGKYDCAIDLLTECYFINPHNSSVLYEFAMIYTNIQDIEPAIKFMSLASIEDKSNSWYKMGLAELCVKKHDYNNAILIYKDIAKNHPDAEDVDYMLASLYKQTNQPEESIISLNKVEKKNGINETISFEKFRLYSDLGQTKKAYAEIDKLIEKFPLEFRYHLLRSEVYLKEQNKPKEALLELEKVKKTDPNNGMLLLAFYDYYKFTKDTLKANEVFSNAFKNDEISVEDKMGLLTQFLSIENQSSETAEEYFNLLIKEYPTNEMLRTYYASFLLMQRRYDDAIPELEKMLAINPKNKEGWIELIKAYIDQNKSAEVYAVVERALTQLPKEAVFYLHKGLYLIEEKKNDEAIQIFKKGLSVSSSEEPEKQSDFYMYIADIFAQDLELDSAFVYYENAYQLNSNNALLLNNYAYYLSIANKELSKAEVMSAKTVQVFPENVSFLDTYAWIFFMQGNMTLAYMYIQQAMDKGGDENPIVMEHYGDILFLNGDKEEGVKWWGKSKEKGNESKILQEKIDTQTYIPEKQLEK